MYDALPMPQCFSAPPSAPSARMQGSLSMLIDALKNSLTSTAIALEQEVKKIEQIGESLHVEIKKNNL